jgi:surface antigen
MLLSGASLVVPPVPVAMAAQIASPDARGSEAEAPESNPYADPSQCIYRAWDLAAEAGHKLPWFAGNAADWKEGALEHGYEVVDTIDPSVVNTVAVWESGAGGASWAGHVGWVVEVRGDQFRVQDRNWIPGADDERWVTWVEGISFIKLEEEKEEEEQPQQPGETPAAAAAQTDAPTPEAAPEPAAAPQAVPEPGLAQPEVEPAPGPALQRVDLLQLALAEAARLLQPWNPEQATPGLRSDASPANMLTTRLRMRAGALRPLLAVQQAAPAS